MLDITSYPTYTPDRWVILKITRYDNLTDTTKSIYKVFAGWLGGFTQGQSWKLNSGIVKVETEENFYLFYGHSGSVYQCFKGSEGMSSYMYQILENFKATAINAKIEIVPVTEVLERNI